MDATEEIIGIRWLIHLRWLAVLAQLTVFAVAYFVLNFQILAGPFLLLVSIVLISNVFFEKFGRLRGAASRLLIESMLVLDIIVLTLMLYFYGGHTNPFSTVYLVQVIIAALFLGRRETWAMVGLSSICFGALFFYQVPVAELAGHDHHQSGPTFSLHLQGMYFVFVLVSCLLAYFITRLREALDRRGQEIARLRAQASREEKLAALATLAGGAAHELRTPLGTIAVAAHELGRSLVKTDPQHAALTDVQLISTEVQRCEQIIRDMGGNAGDLQGEMPQLLSIDRLLSSVQTELGRSRSRLLEIRSEENLSQALIPPKSLTRALLALVKNAIDATDAQQPVILEVQSSSGALQFRVKNPGPAIDPEVLSRIGEPFFTTKPPGKGMGLGVFLVRLFADQVGGIFSIESMSPEGTIATLSIPLRVV